MLSFANKTLLIILMLIIGFCGMAYCKDFKEDGIHKTHFPNGQLKTEEVYRNGKRNGLSKIYDEEGNLSVTAEFKDDELVQSWVHEPKRDFGKFGFLLGIKFWAFVIVVGLILGFIWVNNVFKNRPL